MWLDTTNSTAENTLNTIVHESVHIFQHAVKYANEDEIGKEFEAYSIAQIVMNLIVEHNRLTTPKE